MRSHHETKKAGKIVIVSVIIVSVLLLLVLINFIPAFSLQTKGMSVLEGEWVNVYYESEEEAAKDVFAYADAETGKIAGKLGFSEKQNVNIYIYDRQGTMQMKKYGLIGPLLGLDWYIGDNIGTNVILTSPANPGKAHTYEDNKYAVLHEIVHAYVSVINPDIQLWLTEGMALYLSNGEAFHKEYIDRMGIPSYKHTQTINPITFSNCGGYTFAHIYIEYLDAAYGWDKVMELIGSGDYETVFGKSSEDIYAEWVAYLNDYPQ
ncbi:MAG: hypothetical protein IJ825_07630 [Oscillospiraceae bacterium]|nr:hypothetical protein [Oscillospiraceae bacterium]